ncbi:MAG: TonB-dependent receptor, partial [Lacunisphaera sp.]|nr:TonB-dependent receptor [Lacunisphaera sp.]
NIPATSPATVAALLNYENYSQATQKLVSGGAIADGPLFALPGGSLRTAVGVDYSREEISAHVANGRIGADENAVRADGSRNTKSVFAELSAPIVGQRNSMPGIKSLKVSLSARYDKYSDFGATTNPKAGFTYQPISSLTLRANYGKAYNAPSLADTVGAVDSRVTNPYAAFGGFRTIAVRPGDPAASSNRPTIVVAGGNPGLKPQKADTWSAGADWDVKFVKGLTLSATYYSIVFKDQIAVIPFYQPVIYSGAFDDKYIINPTIAQFRAFTNNLRLDGSFTLQQLYGPNLDGVGGNAPYLLADGRRNNLGTLDTNGLDFAARYFHSTSFGNIHGNIGGNYVLKRVSQALPGTAWIDERLTQGRFSYSATAGVVVKRLTADATANVTPGYHIDGFAQDWVKKFYTFDLFFAYDLSNKRATSPHWNSNLSVTLNIKNVLDKDPIRVPNGGYNGGTLGRYAHLGVTKKF